MLKIEGVTKKFKKTSALKAVDLQLVRGSTVGMVGPNGSGKSTLLNLISGLLSPTEGKIAYKDVEVSSFDGNRRIIGYSQQNFQLHKDRRLISELNYLIELSGLDPVLHGGLLLEFLNKYNLSGQVNKKIGELSFGNLQKINLFQACLNDPEIVLMDEPFVSLDLKMKNEIKSQIQEIISDNRIIIISSHNLLDIMELCDSFIFLNEGELVRYIDINSIKNNFYSLKVKHAHIREVTNILAIKTNLNYCMIDENNEGTGFCKIIVESLDDSVPVIEMLPPAGLVIDYSRNCTMEELYLYFIREIK